MSCFSTQLLPGRCALLMGCVLLVLTLFVPFSSVWAQASGPSQTLTLHDGQVFKGAYQGGTQDTLLLVVRGDTMAFTTAEVHTLTFELPPPPTTPPEAAVAEARTPEPLILPAGSRLMVRTQSLLTTGQVRAGDRFTAVLEADLIVGGQVVAAQGTPVYGRIVEARAGKRMVGRARLVLELTDLSVQDQLMPVVTDRLGLEGDPSGMLKRTAGGAALGGIIEGDDGVATGAAIGAGLSLLTPGKQIQLPPGTLIEFRTQQPLTMQFTP